MGNNEFFRKVGTSNLRCQLCEKLFFFHLPKCGGISTQKALFDGYKKHRNVADDALVALDAGASFLASSAIKQDLYIFREGLLRYFLEKPESRCVAGHFACSESLVRQYRNKWCFVTVLRNPVKKWISNYFYNRYNPNRKHVFKLYCSLLEFLDTEEAKNYGNDYIRQTLGIFGMSNTEVELLIDKAINVLEQFSVVGILENMDRFVADLECCLGFQIALGLENKNPVNTLSISEELTNDVLNKIEELCEPNIRVYNHFLSRQGEE